MNFLDLYKRVKELDESLAPPSQPALQSEDDTCNECGGDMPMPAHQAAPPKQQDSVTMNVTMNGSGEGGIRDLLSVLKKIESDDAIVDTDDVEVSVMDDNFENSPIDAPEDTVYDLDAVTGTGDDLHANLGDPRQRKMDMPSARPVSESLVRKLSNHYAEVKDRVSEGYGMRRYRSPGSGMGWSQEAEKRAFKRDELEHELRHEEDNNGWGIYINGKFWKAVRSERQAKAIVNTLQSKGKEAKASYGSYF